MELKTFIEFLFGDLQGWLCLARIHRLNGKGFSEVFYDYPRETEDAVQWIRDNDQWGTDLYICPHLFSQSIRKKDYALAPQVLWADLDTCHPKNLGKFGEPKPSLVLQTSPGRYQAYWSLKKHFSPEEVEKANKKIAYAYRDYGCDISGWDLTQLLRVPTRNWKRVSNG